MAGIAHAGPGIIGVAPAGFHGARLGEQADIWLPRNLLPRVSAVPKLANGRPVSPEDAAPILAIARLAPLVTVAQAQRQVTERCQALNRSGGCPLAVIPLSDVFGTPNQRTIIINEGRVVRVIATAALVVLVGGCATLMALVLVHYERRRREFAVRLAMGASRGRWRGNSSAN